MRPSPRPASTVYPTTPGYEEEEMEVFFPHEVVKFGIIIAVIISALTFLATMVPMPVGEPADPLRTPVGIEPEWYFLAVYQILKYVPRWLGVGFSFIVFPVAALLRALLLGAHHPLALGTPDPEHRGGPGRHSRPHPHPPRLPGVRVRGGREIGGWQAARCSGGRGRADASSWCWSRSRCRTSPGRPDATSTTVVTSAEPENRSVSPATAT